MDPLMVAVQVKLRESTSGSSADPDCTAAFAELERRIRVVLETYSNVHRGTGHNSVVSTLLYEHARAVILAELGLPAARYALIFATPARAEFLKRRLVAGSYRELSSRTLGLPLGLRALAVEKRALPRGVPFQTGGGTVKLVSARWAIWADAPDRFEAGTPEIVNAIAFAVGLQLARDRGSDIFSRGAAQLPASEPWPGLTGPALLEALRDTLIGRAVQVPTAGGNRAYINLDNGASTPTFEPIWEAVRRAWRRSGAGAAPVEEARRKCTAFLGAPPEEYEFFFVGNTTEALNWVARGLPKDAGSEPVIVNTLAEHNSNELPWRSLAGASLIRMAVDAEGFVDPAALEGLLQAYNRDHRYGAQRIRLVAINGASNVLGAFNDLAGLSELVHRYGARLLVDGAQLVAHRRIEMVREGVDYLAFSGHKAYAPFGSGGLVVRRGLLDLPAEEQALLRASGEENLAGIAALEQALSLLQRIGMDVVETTERALTGRLLEKLGKLPDVELFGIQGPQSPRFERKGSVVVFSLKHVPHNRTAQDLAEYGGIGVRCGCFCAHLLMKRLMRIHPLRARAADFGLLVLPGFTATILPGLVRVSLGIENTSEEIDRLAETVERIVREPLSRLERWLGTKYNGTPFLPHTAVGKAIRAFAVGRAREVYGDGIGA